jgi:hypothetical protein
MNKTVKMTKSSKAKFESNLYSGQRDNKINKPKRGKNFPSWD